MNEPDELERNLLATQMDECSAPMFCHPDGLRFLQAGGPMQGPVCTSAAGELHGSSGAKERRHQDDKVFP